MKKKQLSLAVTLGAMTLAGQSMAQDRQVQALQGDDFYLEEVLVTARKKVENLQTVPIAIDAITAQQLDEKAITSLEDVAKYSPGLTFDQGVLPNDTRPVIRGMSINRGRPNVAILVDGIDISSETMTVAGGGAFANLSLLDLERVEVIKGPQSATYGRSAFAGAVSYITKRPSASDGIYGYIESEADEHGYMKGYGNLTFPIIQDKLGAGITLFTSDFDGFYENPNTGGDLGGIEQDGVAVTLNYNPGGIFSAYFRGEYADEHYDQRAVVMSPSISNVSEPGDFFLSGSLGPNDRNVAIPGGTRGIPEVSQAECDNVIPFAHLYGQPFPCNSMQFGDVSGVGESDLDQSPNPETGRDFDGTDVENTRLTLELAWSLDSMEIVSLTGYTDNETSVEEDFDNTNLTMESGGPGSANFDPQYRFVDPFGDPPDFTLLGNDPTAAFTQFGVRTNSDTSFDYDQFSQEIRITGEYKKLDWMLDFLYWEENMDAVMNQMWWANETMDTTYWNAILSRFVDPTCTTPGRVDTCALFTGVQENMVPNEIPMARDTEHWSIATSLVYNFTDNVRATVEGRYLDETIDYESLPLDTFINGFLNMPYFNPETFSFVPEMQEQTVDADEFVPRVSVDWQVNDNLFTYASAGKGFKPGGIATTDGNGDISSGHYKPEKLWAYEVGFKSDLLGNRLRLNGAVFYNDYTDQQVPFFITNSVGVTNVSVTNAGESEIIGAEIEASYRPSANWVFTAAYTHVDTEYEDFNISDVGEPSTYDKVLSGNEFGDFSGKKFTNTPEDTAVLSARYQGEFGNGVKYFAEVFTNYLSKRYLDQGNLSYLPSIWLTDVTVGLTAPRWQITAYVNNVTDEEDIQSGLGNVSYGFMPSGQIPPYGANLLLPNPQTVGIRARYMF